MTSLENQLKTARKIANRFEFGTSEWENSMKVVRALVEKINKLDNSEFTSIDSGVHKTIRIRYA